jgi:hypothetical protein
MIILTIQNLLHQNQNEEAPREESLRPDAIIIRPQNPGKIKTEKDIFQQNLERRPGAVVPDQQ